MRKLFLIILSVSVCAALYSHDSRAAETQGMKFIPLAKARQASAAIKPLPRRAAPIARPAAAARKETPPVSGQPQSKTALSREQAHQLLSLFDAAD